MENKLRTSNSKKPVQENEDCNSIRELNIIEDTSPVSVVIELDIVFVLLFVISIATRLYKLVEPNHIV